MSTELIQSLSNDHSRAQVEALLCGALREQSFAEMGALLDTWIDQHPGSFTALCRDTRDVAVGGWDALKDELEARGPGCTAIGIDLSGYWEETGPGFEVSFYSDTPFPFSTSDRTALLAATETDAPVWQGRYEDVRPLLTCTGLETLDAALRDYPYRHWNGSDEMPEDFPAYFAAVWFLYLRVNEALARSLESNSLPRSMPVVVGQHDYGPSFETVYVVEPASYAEPVVPVAVLVESSEPIAIVEVELQPESATETGPQAEVAVDEGPEPSAPARSWSWRRTAVRPDAGETGSADPITQRRRGPGSFAA